MKPKSSIFRLSLSVLLWLAALTWFEAAQPALADEPAQYQFTSNSPSAFARPAAFTLSATGDATDPNDPEVHYPPFGLVSFYDGDPDAGGTEINGCHQVRLNVVVDPYWYPLPGVPAVCQTSGLSAGQHTITAVFTSYLPDLFPSGRFTLQHTVNFVPLTITPDTLPRAQVGTHYSETLTTSGTSNPVYWTWRSDGDLPAGLLIGYYSGAVNGVPAAAGDFTFTVTAQDYKGGYATKDYSLTVDKATPAMTLKAYDTAAGDKLSLEAVVSLASNLVEQPTGTVSFSIDGAPIAACSGDHAVAVVPYGTVYCYEDLPADVAEGDHIVRADYAPDAASDPFYVSTFATASFHAYSGIQGVVFDDTDMDGVRDEGEEIKTYWKLSLDKGCDGTVDATQTSHWSTGLFFFWVDGGTYCLAADEPRNWRQTTPVGPFTVDGGVVRDIGVVSREIQVEPESLEGDVGVAFNGVLTASGGTPPYAFTLREDCSLPTGLTSAVDGNAGTLTISGTPTQTGVTQLVLMVTDAEGVSKEAWARITIRTFGTFALTSSANPSGSGQEVTFTFTGTGSAYYPGLGEIPPIGTVTLKDGDTDIPGCTDLYLNIDTSTYEFGDFPAVCKTSALTDGSHTIKALYTDLTVFHDATQTLTQYVGADPTPPVITPNVTGTKGQDGWYTSNVKLSWTVTDLESPITSQTGCDSLMITGDQPATKYTCSATSAGGTTSVDVTIQRDATKPVTQVTGVTEGSKYPQGGVPQAGCATTDNLSNVGLQATLTLSGGDPQGLGDITATCAGALDKAGNAAFDAVVHYTVVPTTSADLKLTNMESRDPVRAGAILQYTLTLTNLGPDAAQSVRLVDTLDPNTTFLYFTAPQGAKCSYRAGVVTCTGTGLPSGKGASIVITVMVKRRTPAGTILANRAEVTSATYDLDLTNNSVSQNTTVGK